MSRVTSRPGRATDLQRRLDALLALIHRIEAGEADPEGLLPFIFEGDADHEVVSSAALHAVPMWPGSGTDPLLGARTLRAEASRLLEAGDEARATAILAGLVLLGDRRITEVVGPCWRELSLDAREHLSQAVPTRPFAAVVDWLLDWLEECEGRELAFVATALARIPGIERPPAVVEVERALPVWRAVEGEEIRVLDRWTFLEYGQRIRRRLLQVAADEEPERVMHLVLQRWGMLHDDRMCHGVALRAPAAGRTSRPLLPLLEGHDVRAKAALTSHLIPLEDDDFRTRDGRVLLSWAIFNPFGPTWSSIGAMETEDPDVDVLFYRMLNPFQQVSGIWAGGGGRPENTLEIVGGLVTELFRRNGLADADGEQVPLIAGSAPTLVHVNADDDGWQHALRQALLECPALQALDLKEEIFRLRQDWLDPWGRTSAALHGSWDPLLLKSPGVPDAPRSNDPETVARAWLDMVTHEEHLLAEFVHFPTAWHGAIDQAPGVLASRAYTFWQLDDFLARYEVSGFREVAEALEEGEGLEEGEA